MVACRFNEDSHVVKIYQPDLRNTADRTRKHALMVLAYHCRGRGDERSGKPDSSPTIHHAFGDSHAYSPNLCTSLAEERMSLTPGAAAPIKVGSEAINTAQ